MRNQEWYTPPHIIQALGEFDLDPCFPVNPIYQTAKKTFNKIIDGLKQEWFGRVWMNPPYLNLTPWFEKMVQHNNGIALIPARTDTVMFQSLVFRCASSILFLKGRVSFFREDGQQATHNSGNSSVLIAYNEHNSERLLDSGLPGKHIWLAERFFVVNFEFGHDEKWRLIIQRVLVNESHIEHIYERVAEAAPSKVQKNQHWKAKVRQILQKHFKRTQYATYTLFE